MAPLRNTGPHQMVAGDTAQRRAGECRPPSTALIQDFSYQTCPTYDRNTTTTTLLSQRNTILLTPFLSHLKASYFFCAQNGPSITHSSQHNGTSWKRVVEGQSFGLMLQLICPSDIGTT